MANDVFDWTNGPATILERRDAVATYVNSEAESASAATLAAG